MPSANEQEESVRRHAQQNTQLLNLLVLYFRLVALLLGVWILGYFGFSASWVFIGLFIYIFNEKFKRKKQLQIEIGQELAKNEKQTILARVEDLPSWVFFPDIERAEWVNKILEQMWPYIGDFVKKTLLESVEPQIVANLPNALKSFKFVKIDLGNIPPRIGGIKAYIENVKRDEIVLDLDLIYASDADIKVSLKGLNAGIKDLQIRGNLRVILRPLIPVAPLIGGVTVFFLTNPHVDFNLTDVANALDIPGLSDSLRSIVQDQIAAFLVLPNRIPISLADNIDVGRLKHPLPQGVLRIHAVEAKDLKKADIGVFGKGKSDPYVNLHVGAQQFKTEVIKNTLNPMWNEFFEAIVDQRSGQSLEFEVMDEDPGSSDDFLGRGHVELESVAEKGMLDSWIPLEEIKQGIIHFRLTWLHLSPDPSTLAEVRHASSGMGSAPLSSCLLSVTVDSADDLPKTKKGIEDPSPYAIVTVGGKSNQTRIVDSTSSPRWEDNFQFLINDPNIQKLEVEVKDKKSGNRLGILNHQIKLLLTESNMTQDHQFPLRESDPDSKIALRIVLRILTSEVPSDWVEQTDSLLTQKPPKAPDDVSAKPDPPQETSIDDADIDIGLEPGSPSHSNNVDESSSELRRRINNLPPSPSGSSGLGRIQLTIRYSQQRNKLIVVVHKCTNLIPCDSDHLSDPYVRIYLLPEKNTLGKKKTQVVKNNLNPVYDETFEFAVNPQDLDSRSLDVGVKNHVGMFGKGRKDMGQVIIDLAKYDLTKAITDWFDLLASDRDDKSNDSSFADRDKETAL